MFKFRSKFERNIYESATRRQRELDYEPKDATLDYTKTSKYLPDFRLTNGILIEAKGHFIGRDRTKALLVRKQNPGVDIRFVFQRASNRLTKAPNSKMYWEWCEQNGFKWAEGHIPEEWFEE